MQATYAELGTGLAGSSEGRALFALPATAVREKSIDEWDNIALRRARAHQARSRSAASTLRLSRKPAQTLALVAIVPGSQPTRLTGRSYASRGLEMGTAATSAGSSSRNRYPRADAMR